MIKGINRRIIDVSDPDGKYFERALLFVRPEAADLNRPEGGTAEKKLSAEADRILSLYNQNLPQGTRQSRKKNHTILKRLIFAVSWSAIGAGAFEVIRLIF